MEDGNEKQGTHGSTTLGGFPGKSAGSPVKYRYFISMCIFYCQLNLFFLLNSAIVSNTIVV